MSAVKSAVALKSDDAVLQQRPAVAAFSPTHISIADSLSTPPMPAAIFLLLCVSIIFMDVPRLWTEGTDVARINAASFSQTPMERFLQQ